MEIMMSVLPRALSRALATVLLLSAAQTAVAQAPVAPPLAYPPPLLTLAEARAVIEGAIAYARESNMRMAVVVVDSAGNVVSSDRMDGAALQNIRFAEGKVLLRRFTGKPRKRLGSCTRLGRTDTSAS
jgi:glc operon protein GlcG